MAVAADITALLQSAQNPDANLRTQAELQLKQFQEQNFPGFVFSLASELANNDKPIDARRLAGLILKNSLDAKDEKKKVRGRVCGVCMPASLDRSDLAQRGCTCRAIPRPRNRSTSPSPASARASH